MPFALVSSGDTQYYLSLHSGLLSSYKIHVSQLDLESTGKSAAQPIQLADSEVGSQESILYAGNNGGVPLLLWTDKTYKTLKFNLIGSKQVTAVSVSSRAGENVDNIVAYASGSSADHPHILVHFQTHQSHWAEVYHVKGSKVSKAYDLPNIGGRGAFSVSGLGNELYFIRHSTLETTLYSSKDTSILAQWKVKSASPDPIHATSEVVMRAGSKYSLRSAVALASGDFELFRNGEILWSRPEGLTGVVAAGFVDFSDNDGLLEDLAIESHSSLIGAYFHRLKRHAKQLQYLPGWIHETSSRILPNLMGMLDNSEDPASSYPRFGFNKIAIVATSSGRLAALDMGNHGTLLWSIQAVGVPYGKTWVVSSIDQENGDAVVRGAQGAFLRIATSTGKLLAYQPEEETTSLKTYLQIVNSRGTVDSIPVNRDGSLGEIANIDLDPSVVLVTEGEDSIFRGWRLLKDGQKVLAWQFAPIDGQHIQSVQIPPAHDPVASIGKALGDRNVLYKYLNPNIFLITTVGLEDSTANFYLIDSTSGSIIYSTAHTGVDTSQSISSTVTENWFAYSLFSESATVIEGTAQVEQKKARGYRLVVSELFESPFPNDRGPLGNSANSSTVHPLVAEGVEIAENPHVISQSFFIPGPISHMTTTSTLQGITPRSLLCTLPGMNALMSIPRYMLDPRRPVGRDPTPLEAEEGLFRYNPVLEFEPKWLLSHKRELLSISNVITTPSKLESTSLTLAYGDVDIFGTRVSPIGSFDMLGKGFSKLQLIGTVVALAIGTSLLAPFVSPAISPSN